MTYKIKKIKNNKIKNNSKKKASTAALHKNLLNFFIIIKSRFSFSVQSYYNYVITM